MSELARTDPAPLQSTVDAVIAELRAAARDAADASKAAATERAYAADLAARGRRSPRSLANSRQSGSTIKPRASIRRRHTASSATLSVAIGSNPRRVA